MSLAMARARSFLAEAERARDLVMIQMEDAQTFLAITRSQMSRAGTTPPGSLTEQLQLAEARLARVQQRQRQVASQLVEAQVELEQASRLAGPGMMDGEPEGSVPHSPRIEVLEPRLAGSLPGDAEGYDLKPDPLTVTTAAELIDALNRWRVWAGEISFRKMAENSKRASASAICAALGSTSLPSLNVVVAVIEGCGGTTKDTDAWATAWRLIRTGKRVPYVEEPPRPPAPARPARHDDRWPIRAAVPRFIRSVDREPPPPSTATDRGPEDGGYDLLDEEHSVT